MPLLSGFSNCHACGVVLFCLIQYSSTETSACQHFDRTLCVCVCVCVCVRACVRACVCVCELVDIFCCKISLISLM